MTVDFGRVVTAMVTPFDTKGNVHLEEVKRLTHHLINTGSTSIVVAGTTGESPTLSKEEKVKLFQTVKETAGDRAKVIANVGNNNTSDSVDFAKVVERETNVDGLLVVNPYYNKPSQNGLYAHFKTVAEATKLPIMLYNIPGRTSVNLEAETTIRLSKIDNIVAIKESSGNLDQMAHIIAGTDDSFKLYSGDDNLTLPIISIGGYGVVSVASHFFGREILTMIRKKDDVRHRAMLPFFQVLFIDTNPIGAKYLLNQNGFETGGLRLPLVDTDDEKKETMLQTYIKTKQILEYLQLQNR